jgi:acetyltransferase-like isoleucine patch superfamily enzyme
VYGRARNMSRRLRALLVTRYLNRRGVIAEGAPSFNGPWPTIENEGAVLMGRGCTFNAFRLPAHIVVREQASLEIGAGSYLNDGVNICATQSIRIGRDARIGDMTYIYDTHFHEVTPHSGRGQAPVVIGANVWIGANCTVLAGASIGDHSVIGAGSVVTGSIPERSLAVGCPARVIRSLEVPKDWARE